ncbi:MAG TPA: pitrilysin family protein [Bryobacteraceae bacterium]|jgi:zinc protease|nr:pitrilysin family protein [Bryobacteraceae bacterium]
MLRFFAVAALFVGLVPAQQPSVTVRDAGPLPSPESLQYPALHAIHIPKPTVVTLSNGLKVYMLENHELPVVRGSMLIRTGNLFDPKDRRGLATLTGITMRSGGAAGTTADQLNEKLENMAATVETSIAESTGSASFRCLKENTDAVLGVFHDVVTSPDFRQDKIDLAKLQLKSSISRRNDDAAGIASREIYRLVYGPDTPYGGQEEFATVDAVTRDDIIAFYRRYFFPANILMSIYGDFSIPEMREKLETTFGSWTVTQPKVPEFPRVDAKATPGIFFVEKADVDQTFFQMGELGGEVRDKDYAALSVAADVLGAGFSSRLMREVRTHLGYAYDIAADWDADFDHPGIFAISGSTKSQSTTETLDATLQQIDRMRTAEITDQELKTAKDAALNSIVFDFERPSSTLARLVTYDYFGYPEDFLTQYEQAVARVTKADVLRAAKEHFRPELLTIVAVGNEAHLVRPLGTLSRPVRKLDITIPSEGKNQAQ